MAAVNAGVDAGAGTKTSIFNSVANHFKNQFDQGYLVAGDKLQFALTTAAAGFALGSGAGGLTMLVGNTLGQAFAIAAGIGLASTSYMNLGFVEKEMSKGNPMYNRLDIATPVALAALGGLGAIALTGAAPATAALIGAGVLATTGYSAFTQIAGMAKRGFDVITGADKENIPQIVNDYRERNDLPPLRHVGMLVKAIT